MSRFAKSLILLIVTLLVIGSTSVVLALVVDYKPYGVPDDKREYYENKLAEIRQHEQRQLEAKHTANPKAVTGQTRHAFGLLNPHTTASHSFGIRNAGDAPLKIAVQDTTCKCTVGNVADSI